MASTYFFFAFVELKFYFFLTYGNAGRLIPILFWVWIRLQNIFFGVPKSCGTHLKWVAGQDFFVQFWIMSFQQYFSHMYFFFQVLSAKFWHSPQVSCWARFVPKFCWPSCGTYLKWVADQDFFHKFCRPSCGTHLELLAKIFLFSFESCPFNNISVIRIF